MFGNRNKVCQFYLEGRCKFGNGCKFEHPDNQNQNRFAPLSNQSRGRSGAFGGNGQDTTKQNPFSVTTEAIKLELTDERPTWPLSSYGPGRDAPRQLLDAEFEQSPEEMRVLHYIALANGNAQETVQKESSTAEAVNQAIQKILSDINGAVKYVIDGKDQHPNRVDMAKTPFGSQENAPPSQTSSAFGAQKPPQTSAFGQPSSFGRNAQSTTFGQPSAPSQGTSFGQPSSLGGTSFGQPSGLGQNSAFGKPSALGGNSGFGKPSFGQPSQPSSFGQAAQQPAFGQSGFAAKSPFGANTTAQASFGQPSAFGAAANKTSPFGGQANSAQQSPFGAAANTAQPSPFGAAANTSQPSPFGAAGNAAAQSSPFASAAQNQQSTSTFGQPSAFGAANKASPFAAVTNGTSDQPQTSSTFGQPSAFGAANKASPFAAAANGTSTSGTFGQPSAFGTAAKQASPFGQQSQTPSASPFGQASQPQINAFGAPTTAQGQVKSPFAQNNTQQQPAQSSPFSTAAQSNNNTATKQSDAHLSRDGAGRLTAFKGQQVSYDAEKKVHTAQNPQTGRPERIWFPDGISLPQKDAQAPEVLYEGDLGQALAKLYIYVKDNGVFENGVVPEIPPKCEWVAFDI